MADEAALVEALPLWVPVVCGGKVEAEQILAAFRQGADGVLLAVCPYGECHFQGGNLQAAKQLALLREVLTAHGIAPERLLLVASRDPDGTALLATVGGFAQRLAVLGPLVIRGKETAT
jgi:coenzyme F420-reducing hydrogenase delta subunit